jgi:hypothetical protein
VRHEAPQQVPALTAGHRMEHLPTISSTSSAMES